MNDERSILELDLHEHASKRARPGRSGREGCSFLMRPERTVQYFLKPTRQSDTNKGHTTVGRDRHHHVDSFSRLVVHVYVHRPFATENCAMNRVRLQTVALDFRTASYFALATSIASRPWCSDMNT